jgi:hypothetical protein
MLILKMRVNGTVGYQRSFMKFYKASANVNLNWSKILRANPADPTNPFDFYTNYRVYSKL